MHRLISKKLIGLAISFPPLVVIEVSVVVVVLKVVVAFGCKVVRGVVVSSKQWSRQISNNSVQLSCKFSSLFSVQFS